MGGVYGTVELLEMVYSIHNKSVGNNLQRIMGCLKDYEGLWGIMNKNSYIDDMTWSNMVDVFTPYINEMVVSVVTYLFIFYYTC